MAAAGGFSLFPRLSRPRSSTCSPCPCSRRDGCGGSDRTRTRYPCHLDREETLAHSFRPVPRAAAIRLRRDLRPGVVVAGVALVIRDGAIEEQPGRIEDA